MCKATSVDIAQNLVIAEANVRAFDKACSQNNINLGNMPFNDPREMAKEGDAASRFSNNDDWRDFLRELGCQTD